MEWEARPRRGQYRVFQPNDPHTLTHPIQHVPNERTKGTFVFSSLYNTRLSLGQRRWTKNRARIGAMTLRPSTNFQQWCSAFCPRQPTGLWLAIMLGIDREAIIATTRFICATRKALVSRPVSVLDATRYKVCIPQVVFRDFSILLLWYKQDICLQLSS